MSVHINFLKYPKFEAEQAEKHTRRTPSMSTPIEILTFFTISSMEQGKIKKNAFVHAFLPFRLSLILAHL